MEDFNMNNLVGKGSFGEVFKLKNKLNNQIYALKRIISGDSNLSKEIENEIQILFDMPEHPNVIKFHQVFKFDFNSQTAYFIELDLAESSISNLIKNSNQKADEQTIMQYLSETVEGCLFLKRNNTCHRDIKPDNLLIEKGHVKLVDFGESKAKSSNQSSNSTMTLTGTPGYLSPLLFDAYKSNQNKCKHNDEKSDVYSLGLTFLRVCTKFEPTTLTNCATAQVRQEQVQQLLQKVSSVKIKSILTEMLQYDEQKRASFQKVDALLKGKKPEEEQQQQEQVDDDETIKLPQKYVVDSEPSQGKNAQEETKSKENDGEIFAKVLTFLKSYELMTENEQFYLKYMYKDCAQDPNFAPYLKFDQQKDLNNIKSITQAAKEIKKFVEGPNANQNAYYGLALVLAGFCYDRGYGVEKNEATAFNYYKKSADQENSYGQHMCYLCYLNETGTNKDENLAFKYAKMSADQNNVHGLNSAGYCYKHGHGTQKNQSMAFKYFKLSADQGNAGAQKNLGKCYKNGIGTEKNPNLAFKYIKMSADQGNSDEQNTLGKLYRDGTGTDKNPNLGFQYTKMSADQGNSRGQNSLGFCYQNGIGTQQNLESAFKYFKLSADQGNASAQCNLGTCYEEGAGTKINPKLAFKYYKMSADQENSDGQNSLGLAYEKGTGTQEDLASAFQYYKLAADQKNDDAQNNLGICYEEGKGIEQDLDMALKYYQMSADQGNENGKENYQRLAN